MDFGRLVPDGVVVRGTNDRPIEGQYTTHARCAELEFRNILTVDDIQTHKSNSKVLDVAHYLLQDARDDLKQFPWLTGDSILAIVAGSEPTAAVLIGLFYELAKAPHHTDSIVQELKDVNIEDSRALAQCLHLDAVISEALRLYPALPTGGNRKTTKDGVTIGGVYIPPETTIVAPRYVISRRK